MIPKFQTTNGHIEEILREMIVSGEIPGGERINEVELASRFEISRGPVREAVQRLVGAGLLTVTPHKGATVPIVDTERLRDLYEVRRGLECVAVSCVAERATDQDIALLNDQIDTVESRLGGEARPRYPNEIDIHRMIAHMSGNSELVETLERLWARIGLARWRSGASPARAAEAQVEHRGIHAALASRDGERSTALMAEHLRNSLRAAIAAAGES